MQKTLFKSALIGGLIVFIWGLFSWMVFPWHQKCLKKFSSESDVAYVIKDNALTPGMYVLPNTFCYGPATSSSEMEKGMNMMQKGPFMFAAVRPEGIGAMSITPFIFALIIQIIGAFIVSWMLLQTKGLDIKQQVGFVTLFGLSVGILGQLPDWNWWGFSGCYVLTNIVDLVVGWFLASLGIVRIVKR